MAAVTALFITTSVGFILMSTFTDAAAVLLPNQPPVTLLSRQTERLVTVSADGTVRADGLSDDSMYNINFCSQRTLLVKGSHQPQTWGWAGV